MVKSGLQIFVAMAVFAGFVLALLPLHHAGGVTFLVDANTLSSQEFDNGSVVRAHEHTDIDACLSQAGHCVSTVSFITAGDQGVFGARLKTATLRFGNVIGAGLRPLPLVPPPELS
ncbi:MAG: hypothetical protein O2967_20095 [Proteobacteria bacterium]|nr:hypothetical protein [Pseudomonadota bacterium]